MIIPFFSFSFSFSFLFIYLFIFSVMCMHSLFQMTELENKGCEKNNHIFYFYFYFLFSLYYFHSFVHSNYLIKSSQLLFIIPTKVRPVINSFNFGAWRWRQWQRALLKFIRHRAWTRRRFPGRSRATIVEPPFFLGR